MRLLTLQQTAERLGLKLSTVRFWVWQRRIDTVRIGRAVRVSEETIVQLIQRGRVPALRQEQ